MRAGGLPHLLYSLVIPPPFCLFQRLCTWTATSFAAGIFSVRSVFLYSYFDLNLSTSETCMRSLTYKKTSRNVRLALALYPKDEHFMELTESGICEFFTTTDMISLSGSFADAAIVLMVQRAK